jgi:tRNA (cmo5U34)-methyltransferase
MPSSQTTPSWDEETTRQYLDYGRYFIPEREHQWRLLTGLLAGLGPGAAVLELCCGEGLLAEQLLEAYPGARIRALDGSPEMLRRAGERLARFGGRAQLAQFDLAANDWREPAEGCAGVVSSLAIHHLPGPEKQVLFQDVFRMLAPGGVFAIADVVEVAEGTPSRLAADEWDQAVRRLALELDGNLDAFDFFIREGWNMHRYLDPEDIDKPSPLFDQLEWLKAAGFVDIEVCWLFAGHVVFCGRKPAAP